MFTTKYIPLYIVVFLLAGLSCKKPNPTETPLVAANTLFAFNASINGDSIALAVGSSNYYMYTQTDVDANSIIEYTGTMKVYGCNSNCSNSLQLSFKNFTKNSTIIADSVAAVRSYSFAVTDKNAENLGDVVVEWTDSNGSIWTSATDDSKMPKTNSFEVINSTVYNTNSAGQQTKKITARVSCSLFNNSNSISLKNGVITFAVAY